MTIFFIITAYLFLILWFERLLDHIHRSKAAKRGWDRRRANTRYIPINYYEQIIKYISLKGR